MRDFLVDNCIGEGQTLLFCASYLGQVNIVVFLLNFSANPNA